MENNEMILNMKNLESRVEKLELKMENLEVKQNDLQLELVSIKSTLSTLSKSVDKINDGNTWILRILVGGIATAVVGFILKGGLNLI